MARQTKIKVEMPPPKWGKIIEWGIYDASEPYRFLKISWTYYGLLFRLTEGAGLVTHGAEYTFTHDKLREVRDDPELFAAYLQKIEERLNKEMDRPIKLDSYYKKG